MNATLGGRMDEAEMEEIVGLSDVEILGRLVKKPNGEDNPDNLRDKFQNLLDDVYGDEELTTGRQLLSARFDTGDFSPLTSGEIWGPSLQTVQRVRRAVKSIELDGTSTQAIDSYLSIGDGDSAYRLIQQLNGKQLGKYVQILDSRLASMKFSPELKSAISQDSSFTSPLAPIQGKILLLSAYADKFNTKLSMSDIDKVNLWNYVFNAPSIEALKTVFDLAKTLPNGTATLLELIRRAKTDPKSEAALLAKALAGEKAKAKDAEKAQAHSDKVLKNWVFGNMKGNDGPIDVADGKGETERRVFTNTATIIAYLPDGVNNPNIVSSPPKKRLKLATNQQ